jgi:hypothetical protein
MYHELIYHLDLCMFAYHLHAQTLIWPLDPYMEQVSGSNERRENFVDEAHKYFAGKVAYRGPGGIHGWPTSVLIDPIISRYNRLYPWRPVFLGVERNDWLWHNTPTDITGRIKSVHMVSYNGDPTLDEPAPVPPPKSIAKRPEGAGEGDDLLICFEGGTGTIEPSKAANWSLMGYCLARAKGEGAYDVHIVFRGSRSGAVGRAAVGGLESGRRNVIAVRARDETGKREWVTPGTTFHKARGNPDWITDLDFFAVVPDQDISVLGSACRGFSATVKTCIPGIKTCLERIHTTFGRAPDVITVTGHSLGGALASQFTSAMICGTKYGPYGSKLSDNLKTWPWKTLRLITMSAPVVGGENFYTTFNSRIFTRRVMLGVDPITGSARHFHVGSRVHLQYPDFIKLRSPFDDHQPHLIRRRLIAYAKDWEDDLTGVPCPITEEDATEPWIPYTSFHSMLRAQPALQNGLTDILAQHPEEWVHYLEILAEALQKQSSYQKGRGGWNPRTPRISEEEKNEVRGKIAGAVYVLKQDIAFGDHPDKWRTALKDIGGDGFQKFMSLSMLLAAKVKGMKLMGEPLDIEEALRSYYLTGI